jgi:transposase
MRPPSRFILKLTAQQISELSERVRNSPSHRTRQRAHAILLSHKKYTVKSISEIFEVDRNTVAAWISSFETDGVSGLDDEPRTGRPRKIGEDKDNLVKQAIETSPQDPMKVFGKLFPDCSVSKDTFRRAAKRLGYTWKRFRLTLRDKREEVAFREMKEFVEECLESAEKQEIDVYFLDESGCSLKPNIPYGWQPIASSIPIVTGPNHSKRLSVLGLLHHSGQSLYSCVVEGSVDANVVADCLLDFCREFPKDKRNIIFLDNASIHHSEIVIEAMDDIQDMRDVQFVYLPAYSPELNLIEILWKRIKHFWLGIDCYQTIDHLAQKLSEIFSNFGKLYKITFA